MTLGKKLKTIAASLFKKKSSASNDIDTMARFLESSKKFMKDHVGIVPYNPRWPEMFQEEKANLLACLPNELLGRIEHYGSTSMPGMSAKPVIDILVEVTSMEEVKRKILPVLEARGYEMFWKPCAMQNKPLYYPIVIKRGAQGNQSHHICFVESSYEHWDRLLFRDYLIEFPEVAKEYRQLKEQLARDFAHDRKAYADGKLELIDRIILEAYKYYNRPAKLINAQEAIVDNYKKD
jgi:GrpB-like predicted nucleotidyltransferase (UPF0157 family)